MRRSSYYQVPLRYTTAVPHRHFRPKREKNCSRSNSAGTVRIQLTAGSIGDIADQTYTGEAITPNVIVTLDEKVLTAGTDYEVKYEDNTNVGTATATVTGKDNYTGTLTKTFTISPVEITGEMVSLGEDPSYTGSAVKVSVIVFVKVLNYLTTVKVWRYAFTTGFVSSF